jgi:hypothetical protein
MVCQQRPEAAGTAVTVTAIMRSIYAKAEVAQVGPDHYRVTAPLEIIPLLVKARDCMLPPACKVEFFEQAL